MTTVICKHCEHTVSIDDAWCNIDVASKKRFYECKKKCLVPTPETIQIQLDDIQTVADTIQSELERQGRALD